MGDWAGGGMVARQRRASASARWLASSLARRLQQSTGTCRLTAFITPVVQRRLQRSFDTTHCYIPHADVALGLWEAKQRDLNTGGFARARVASARGDALLRALHRLLRLRAVSVGGAGASSATSGWTVGIQA